MKNGGMTGGTEMKIGGTMLTDAHCRTAKAKDRDYKLGDSGGLYLFVSKAGHRSWRLKYRIGGKEKRLVFGSYPDMSLSDAREKRDAARRLIRDGLDPALEAKKLKLRSVISAANTFEALARDWHALQEPRWKPVHAEDVIGSLERDVFPSLGKLPIVEIDAAMTLAVLQAVERRGAIETAHRLRQRVSSVFVYAIAKGAASADPAASLGKALKAVPKKRRRPALVTISGARSVISASDEAEATPVVRLASRFLALTAQRPGMVRTAPWSEFEGIDWGDPAAPAPSAIWRIPPARMKLIHELRESEEFEHIVPLATHAVDVLRTIYRLTGRGPLVFPSLRSSLSPMSENAIGYLYNRIGFKGRHVPHGWRSSFSTIMNEAAERDRRELDRKVIDLMLAHIPEGVSGTELIYNRAGYMDRRREIAQDWGDLLLANQPPSSALIEGRRRPSAD